MRWQNNGILFTTYYYPLAGILALEGIRLAVRYM